MAMDPVSEGLAAAGIVGVTLLAARARRPAPVQPLWWVLPLPLAWGALVVLVLIDAVGPVGPLRMAGLALVPAAILSLAWLVQQRAPPARRTVTTAAVLGAMLLTLAALGVDVHERGRQPNGWTISYDLLLFIAVPLLWASFATRSPSHAPRGGARTRHAVVAVLTAVGVPVYLFVTVMFGTPQVFSWSVSIEPLDEGEFHVRIPTLTSHHPKGTRVIDMLQGAILATPAQGATLYAPGDSVSIGVRGTGPIHLEGTVQYYPAVGEQWWIRVPPRDVARLSDVPVVVTAVFHTGGAGCRIDAVMEADLSTHMSSRWFIERRPIAVDEEETLPGTCP